MDINDIIKYIQQAKEVGPAQALGAMLGAGGGRSTQANGVPRFDANNAEDFQNQAGSFSRVKDFGQSADVPPAEDPIDFQAKILAERIARGEGRIWNGGRNGSGNIIGYGENQNRNTPGFAALESLKQLQDAPKMEQMKIQSNIDAEKAKALIEREGGAFDNESKLRNEFQKLPEIAKFAEIHPVYQSLLKSAKTDSPSSALDFTYGIANILDPGSVVREGEQIMIRNAGGLPSTLVSYMKSLTGKSQINKEMKQELLQLAGQRYNAARDLFNSKSDQYRRIAKSIGANPDNINLFPSTEAAAEEMNQETKNIGGVTYIKTQGGWKRR